METLLSGALVNALLLGLAVVIGVRQLRNAVEVSRTDVTKMRPNSDTSVEAIVLKLIEQAEREVVLYDDGESTKGSLYQSRRVVDALRSKLQAPSFKVDCVLNEMTGTTLFERELGPLDNVRIRQRRENPSTIHYKIFDGTVGYISRHRPGEPTRNRKLIDCTRAQSRFPGKRPLALRRYFEDFHRNAA